MSLKEEQLSTIKAVYGGRNVFVCLPTGYEKSKLCRLLRNTNLVEIELSSLCLPWSYMSKDNIVSIMPVIFNKKKVTTWLYQRSWGNAVRLDIDTAGYYVKRISKVWEFYGHGMSFK